MLVALLFVCAESLTLGRLKLKMDALQVEVRNASNASMDWNTYTSMYCEQFCKMKGVTAGSCTVCEQRMNFSVAEGHVACAVECQGIQTDEVTESVVDCSKHKDECMFKYIEPASCRLECGVPGSKATCKEECHEFKASARAAGDFFTTFHGPNYVDVTKEENVTKQVEVNGTMVMLTRKTGSMREGWAVREHAYMQRRAVGMICPAPRWMASACMVTSYRLKRMPRMGSSARAPSLEAHWKADTTWSLISLRYCTPTVLSTNTLGPVVSGPKHQILRAKWTSQP